MYRIGFDYRNRVKRIVPFNRLCSLFSIFCSLFFGFCSLPFRYTMPPDGGTALRRYIVAGYRLNSIMYWAGACWRAQRLRRQRWLGRAPAGTHAVPPAHMPHTTKPMSKRSRDNHYARKSPKRESP